MKFPKRDSKIIELVVPVDARIIAFVLITHNEAAKPTKYESDRPLVSTYKRVYNDSAFRRGTIVESQVQIPIPN